MKSKDFFERFQKLLENVKERYGLDNIHDTLILWFAENNLGLDPEDVKERIVVDSKAEGVDAVLVDQRNYKLFLVTAKTVSSFKISQRNLQENDVKLFASGVRFLIKGEYKGKITPELENLVDEYHGLDKTGDYTTSLLILTLRKPPTSTKFIDEIATELGAEKLIFDFDQLLKFYEEHYLTMKAAPPDKISFQIITDLLKKDSPIKSRVFTCKGKELARIYNDFRERIFQENVRYSLGMRSKGINKQILETARSQSRGQEFWYFNNGITIVCKKINETAGGKVINLKNAQVINGAQTTYALYEAYQDGTLRDDVEVIIKAIESNERQFIENVTLYTNSQNAIRLRDLCSNDEIQITVQKVLLDTYRYFYERKRGEIDSLHPMPEEKKKLLGSDYKNRIISNENAAQAFLAIYLNKPAEAKSEKGRIFIKDQGGFYEDVFNLKDSILQEKLLLAWKLLKYVVDRKKEYRKKYKRAENLTPQEMKKVYRYDFLLHSEYFIINLLKDFLKNKGFNIEQEKDSIVSIINGDGADEVKNCYEDIVETLAGYIKDLRKDPKYYHNKFFKSSGSIAIMRKLFNSKYNYVDIL
jgi:hypothetical protein